MESCSSTLQLGRKQQSPLDHESSYRLDVLGFTDGETEEQLEENLRSEAKELGVDVVLSPRLKPLSTRTLSSDPSRRLSVYSTASQSTGLTSTFSEVSSHQIGKRSSRASLSLRDYDIFMARGVTNERRTSMSFSPPLTPALSTFSLPLSSPEAPPKKHLRVIRGLSMLRLHRSASDGCPHCPQDPLSQRRAVHKLPCGHKLCTQALRNTIKSVTASKTGAVPSCCGVPIPGTLFEQVMTTDEQKALLEKLEQWDEAISIAPSMASEIKDSGQDARPSTGLRRTSNESKVDSVGPHMNGNLERMQDRAEFRKLREEQGELERRFTSWQETQRAELLANHERLRKEMKSCHESTEEDLVEHHGIALVDAEDKQVKAEADLREVHEQEQRDNATALKHMEAYCAGTYSTGEAHNRTVTEQDRTELEKARRIRDTMDSKHESAINVLRGEQGRRMKLRQQRQDRELQELRRTQRKEELELERACTSESQGLESLVNEKQKKMLTRHELQNAILGKKIESEADMVVKRSSPSIVCELDETNGLSVALGGPPIIDCREQYCPSL